MIRKVVSDYGNFLKIQDPCMQARELVIFKQLHPYYFFYNSQLFCNLSKGNVHYSNLFPTKKFRASKGMFLDDSQHLQGLLHGLLLFLAASSVDHPHCKDLILDIVMQSIKQLTKNLLVHMSLVISKNHEI